MSDYSIFSEDKPVFVFGSNVAGLHKAGAAQHAMLEHGAILGKGVGIQGNSYAIPTKDARLRPLPLFLINLYVKDFLVYASNLPGKKFYVTRIGTGYAGYSDQEIAPMFMNHPTNLILPEQWDLYLL